MQKSFFKQVVFQALFNIIVVVGLGIALNFVFAAWSEPPAAPPAGNVEAPINVGAASQYKSGAFGVGGIFAAYSNVDISGQIKISGGNPGAGKVLTSDVNGLASWQTFSGEGVSFTSVKSQTTEIALPTSYTDIFDSPLPINLSVAAMVEIVFEGPFFATDGQARYSINVDGASVFEAFIGSPNLSYDEYVHLTYPVSLSAGPHSIMIQAKRASCVAGTCPKIPNYSPRILYAKIYY